MNLKNVNCTRIVLLYTESYIFLKHTKFSAGHLKSVWCQPYVTIKHCSLTCSIIFNTLFFLYNLQCVQSHYFFFFLAIVHRPIFQTGIIKVSSNLNKLLLLIERWGLWMEKWSNYSQKRLQRILEPKSSTSTVYGLCLVNGEWISISDFILFTVCFCAVWLKVA